MRVRVRVRSVRHLRVCACAFRRFQRLFDLTDEKKPTEIGFADFGEGEDEQEKCTSAPHSSPTQPRCLSHDSPSNRHILAPTLRFRGATAFLIESYLHRWVGPTMSNEGWGP